MSKKTNSIIDLVVLGILLKEPMNAYRLTQFVEQQQVTRLVKLSTPAIYKSCRRLSDQGNLRGEAVRDGEAPEKILYEVTDAGVERFEQLMVHFSKTLTPHFFDINSVVYNLVLVDFEKGLEIVDAYIDEVETIRTWLGPHFEEVKKRVPNAFGNRMIVKQYVMVFDVLAQWAQELREEFVAELGNRKN